MNICKLWLLALALYAAPALSFNVELLKNNGLIIQLDKHLNDFTKNNIRWKLKLPDGTPLHELEPSVNDSPRYYLFGNELKKLVKHSGDDAYLDFRIYGKKPMTVFNNKLGSWFNIGQNQFDFFIRLHLDTDLEVSTDPEMSVPILDDISYSIKPVTQKYIIRIFFRTFDETRQLWERYLANTPNDDVVDGAEAMREETLLGMYTQASVVGEMMQNAQFNYVTSPVGFYL